MDFLIITGLIGFCLIIAALIFKDWRRGALLLFIWLYLENVIRVSIPGKPPQVLLVKDAIIGLTYVSFFCARVVSIRKAPFPSWTRIFFLALPTGIIGFISAMDRGVDLQIIGLGLRGYYFYIPLALLGYDYFRTQDSLKKFCRVLVYLCIPLLGIAILQYIFQGSGSVYVLPIKGEGLHSATLTPVFLPPGIFGSGPRFARVVFFSLMVSLAFLHEGPRRWRDVLDFAIIAAPATILLIGYRTTILVTLFCGAFFLFFHLAQYRTKILKIAAISVLVIFGIFSWRQDLQSFLLMDTKSEIQERPLNSVAAPFEVIGSYGLFGYGLGTNSQGMGYLTGLKLIHTNQITSVEDYIPRDKAALFESGLARVAFENGLLGLIFWLIFLAVFLNRCRKEVLLQRTTFSQDLALGIFLFILGITVESVIIRPQTYQDATTMSLYWFFTGVLFKLREFPNNTNYSMRK